MADAGPIIIFVAVLAGFAIWTAVFLLFTAHYFLVTLIESGTGQDEVIYPAEPLFERCWKPIFCLWLLAFWGLVFGVLAAPLLIEETLAMSIVVAMLVWVMFPISVLSALTTRWWIHFVHVPIVSRLLRHYGALVYVYLITLFIASCAAAMFLGVFQHNLLWALPTAVMLPIALLLYARHWGRLVWLVHAETPKKKRRRRSRSRNETPQQQAGVVQPSATSSASPDAICEGLPASPHAFEEDEWEPNKKPYAVTDAKAAETAHAISEKSADNKPASLAQYYDERKDKEENRKEKTDAALPFSFVNKKPANFKSALLDGVWVFMIYPPTLQVWTNLVVLTMVELFFLVMLVKFWPDL